jgi:hypothetical protein
MSTCFIWLSSSSEINVIIVTGNISKQCEWCDQGGLQFTTIWNSWNSSKKHRAIVWNILLCKFVTAETIYLVGCFFLETLVLLLEKDNKIDDHTGALSLYVWFIVSASRF